MKGLKHLPLFPILQTEVIYVVLISDVKINTRGKERFYTAEDWDWE